MIQATTQEGWSTGQELQVNLLFTGDWKGPVLIKDVGLVGIGVVAYGDLQDLAFWSARRLMQDGWRQRWSIPNRLHVDSFVTPSVTQGDDAGVGRGRGF